MKGRPTPRRPRRDYHDCLSAHVQRQVRNDPDASRHTIALLRLVDLFIWFQRRGLRCYVRQGGRERRDRRPSLAERIGVSERTIRRFVVHLEALGVLEVTRSDPINNGDGTFTRSTNVYKLHFRKMPGPRTEKPQVAPSGHERPQQLRSFVTDVFTESPRIDVDVGPPVDGDADDPYIGYAGFLRLRSALTTPATT